MQPIFSSLLVVCLQCFLIVSVRSVSVVPLGIDLPDGQLNATEGEDFSIDLEVQGSPSSVVWTFSSRRFVIANNSQFLILQNLPFISLTIRAITEDDAGSYFVTLANEMAEVTAMSVVAVQVIPMFLEHPTSLTSLVSEVVQLVCSARGNPIPTITWFRDDAEVVSDGMEVSVIHSAGESVSSSVLVIEEFTIDTAGVYYCNATNNLVTYVSVTSERAIVIALYAPNVTVSPTASLTVNVTYPAALTCLVFAIPLPNITWMKESDMSQVGDDEGHLFITEMDSGNFRTSVLNFTNVFKSDESYYTCVANNDVRNVLGTPTGGSVALIVQVPPTVIPLVSSSPLYAIQGEIVTLLFNITDADPQVQLSNRVWTLSSRIGDEVVTQSSMSSSHFQFSQDNLALTINHIQLSAHAGTYTLTATNEAGVGSASIEVIVQSPPRIYRIPKDDTVVEGDSTSFECLVLGDPMPEQEWLHDGLLVSFDSRIFINDEDIGTLFFGMVEFQDGGLYTCIYNSSLGDIEYSAELTVQVRPRFTDITVPENATAGSSVTMSCTSTGVPAPSITWLKDGIKVPSILGESVISSVMSELSTGVWNVTSSLQLLGLVLNDTDSYSCRADNVLARPQTEYSQERNLTVLYPPDVSINRVALTVNQSDQASFTCEAFGIPVPRFEWFFNGSTVSLSSDSQLSIMDAVMTNGSGLDIQISTLTIQDSIRSLHEGSYTCRASNGVRNLIQTPESSDAFLTVQVLPLVLEVTEEPLGVVNRSVTISFTIEEASPVVSLQNIQWRFNDSVSLNDGPQAIQLGHVFSSDLLNLTLNSVQHIDQGFYSLTATNEAGTNSSTVFLEVEAAPVITVAPEDVLQLEGEDVMFECQAVSEPQYSVEWLFNGSFVNSSSEKYSIDELIDELIVFDVSLDDTGVYTCFVENIHGNDSALATLSVQAVPLFRINPIALSVRLIGESIELNCSSFAVPPANITWLKDGRLLDVSDLSVEISSSVEGSITFSQLNLSRLSFADTGRYFCMATNNLVSEQSTNSTAAEIIVNMPVILVESPGDSIVNETDTVEYTCIAEGLPAPSFTWSTPQQADLSLEDFVMIRNRTYLFDGATRVESVLTFPNIEETSANNYTCTASNTPRDREETVSGSFSITVQTRPEVMFIGNGTVVGVQFRDTQMTFAISRDLPEVTEEDIRWFFIQQGVNTRREIVPGDQPEHYIFSNDRLTLSIMFLNLSDSGTYTVEASNIVGTGTASAELNVQRAPVIIVPLVSLIQLSGTNAVFICEAEADPQHTIEWTREGEELFNSSKYLITGLGTARSTLTIFDLELSDTGNYSCFAENVHGNDSTSDQLFVQVPPSFTESPTSSNLTAGGSVTITCNVTGFPRPEVELLINGQLDASLTFETSAGSFTDGILYQSVSLFLSNLTFANTAQYSCKASNDLASPETRISASAQFTVQYAPDVSVSPNSIIVNESDAIVLTCEVFAIPEPNIVWLNSSSQDDLVAPTDLGNVVVTLDQLPHPSGFSLSVSNLSISSVLKVHEANYSCIASNGIENLLGTPENGTIPVVVQVPPTVEAEEDSVLGVVGRSAILSLRIERASPEVELANIRWTFTSSQGNLTKDITTSNSSRLSFSEDLLLLNISDIVDEDEGTYTLTASNPAGISSASVNLSVEAAPVFVEVPRNLSRLQGEKGFFRCSAESEPQYSIRWENRGKTIAEFLSPDDRLESIESFTRLKNSTRGVNVTSDANKYLLERDGQLTILDTVLGDGGLYTCIIANVHGSLTASATLTVQVAPTFPGKNFTSLNASVRQNLVIECLTESSPLPNITWYKDGIEIVESNRIRIKEFSPTIQEVNSSLLLFNISRVDDGVYWCNATNFLFVVFEAMSPTTTVSVFYPPNVVEVPTTLQRQAAEYAVFTCEITAFPTPIIQWTRTGTTDPIITERRGKFEIRNTLDDSSVTGPFSVKTQLTVLNLTFTDQQDYTCTGISQVAVDNFINAVNNASASLFVNVPPRVSATTRSPSTAIWEGNFSITFSITFSISNNQPPVVPKDITWRFTPSSNTGTETITTTDRLIFSGDRQSLEINRVRLSDAGTYSLTAVNNGGSSSADVTINVLVRPVIDNISRSFIGSVRTGSTITLICRADGIPTPTLRWFRNGTVATTTGRTAVLTGIGPGLRTEVPTTESVVSNLTVTGIENIDDYSQWTCRVESSIGLDQQSYILRVDQGTIANLCSSNPCQNNAACYASNARFICLCTGGYTGSTCEILANEDRIIPPTILVSPQPISNQLGSVVNLTCIAQGNPQPNIEWYQDNVIISEARTFLYSFELGLNARGWYHCEAVSRLQDGSSLSTSSESVLVTIDNVAQYLMTARVNNVSSLQLIKDYVQRINSEVMGQSLRNDSVVFSVSFHEAYNDSSESNSTFSAVVTVVTSRPSEQELFDLLVSLELNPAFYLIDLIRFDGCISEVTSFSSSIYWPETNLGTTVELDCPCGDLSLGEGRPIAERVCGGSFIRGAIWSAPDSLCDFDKLTQEFCNIPLLPMIGARLQSLRSLLTTNVSELSPLDLLVIVSILENLSLEDVVNDVNMTQDFLSIIDTIISAGESMEQAQREFSLSSRILRLLESFGSLIPLGDTGSISFPRTRFIIAAESINNIPSFSGTSFTGAFVDTQVTNPGIGSPINTDANILIPQTLFDNRTPDTNFSRLVFSMYPNDSPLFQVSSGTLVSTVIAATVPGISIRGLSENDSIIIMFSSDESLENTQCVFWNFDLDDWDSNGCSRRETDQNDVTCICTHLTHFALISGPLTPSEPTEKYADVLDILEYVSVAFAALSIFCFIILFLTYVLSRRLRMDPHSKLFTNISAALILLYAVYIGAIYAKENEISCTVFSGLFHYAILVVLFALFGKAMLSVKFENYPHSVIITSWFIPLLFVGFLIAPLTEQYSSEDFCHPDGLLFYIVLVLPFGLISTAELILVIVKFVFLYKEGSLFDSNKAPPILRLFVLVILFTVGWSFRLAELRTDEIVQVVLKCLFLIFGAMLGIYVLLVYGILCGTVRSAWRSWVTCQPEKFDLANLNTKNFDSDTGTSQMNGKNKPILQFKDMHYGPEADFRSPTPPDELGSEHEKEEAFDEMQERTVEMGSTDSLSSSHSSMGYPVAKSPVNSTDIRHSMEQVDRTQYDTASIDQPDSDEETAL